MDTVCASRDNGRLLITSNHAYDANGNTVTDPSGKSYSWDFENRLTQAVVPGTNGGTTTFRYDPFGRRIQKSGPLGTTNYLYSGSNVLNELNGSGNFIAAYTLGVGVDDPLAQLTSGTASYYEADGLGSLTSLSNATGSLAKTYTYDSFGNLAASTGTLNNSFQYTARESDSETNLYYYRARYYDPTIGRFVSQDPSGPSQGPNLYAYVYNSPTGSVDPSGLYSVDKSCQGKCVSLGGGGPNNPGKPPYNVSLADLIKQGTDNACASSNTITDLKLKRCIQKSCNQGTIKCDCASQANSEGGFNRKVPGITNRTAHVCTESWPNYTDPSYAATWYGQPSIHEWAHGCGWNHGDGGGVPNDPGRGH
ncbi:MAG: RHS repeat-associated core domain-containing protein [Candidatus Sulfotelmatobacter sp.]